MQEIEILTSKNFFRYLDHGLVVTRIYRALQFRAVPVFKHLTEEVTHYRTEADRNPNQKIIAELFKLLGNSYYGKCLTNQLRHLDVQYHEEEGMDGVISDALFKKLDVITDSKH